MRLMRLGLTCVSGKLQMSVRLPASVRWGYGLHQAGPAQPERYAWVFTGARERLARLQMAEL